MKRILNVLVACEASGVVRNAFAKLGHNAYSCDLQPCYGRGDDSRHLIADAVEVAYDSKWQWDLIIAHPPCTFLCNSGVCWLFPKRLKGARDHQRWNKMCEAAQFFNLLWQAPARYRAVENPIPHRYARNRIGFLSQYTIQSYAQIIQPWMFGHTEQKATCLWLHNLPKLTETCNVKAAMLRLPHNKRNRLHYLPPSADRARLRSETFRGVAKAMAEQWSAHILQELATS